MASPRPRGRSLSEVKAKLLNPATTSHYQVMIGDPFQSGPPGVGGFNAGIADFSEYLRRQGVTEIGGSLPIGAPDLAPAAPGAAAVPSAGLGVPTF